MMGVAKKLIKDIRKNKYIYIMAVPVILFYIVFCYVPMGGMLISFQDYSPVRGIFHSKWIGFQNFIDFFSSYQFPRLLGNTLLLSFYLIIFSFPAPLILALLINELGGKAFKKTVQTISYLPHFISLVVICGIVVDFTSSEGVINQILGVFGVTPVSFLMRPERFRPLFVVSDIWQHVGWGSIIYLAALSGIDQGLYEAAIIDGAGRFHQMISITIPCLLPTITVLFIMRIGNIMSVGYEKVILLYNPTIYSTADIISTYIYRRGLLETNYGISTAVGTFNSIINFIFVWLANRLSGWLSENSLW
jgi:putative aldouronate transport system permease protein